MQSKPKRHLILRVFLKLVGGLVGLLSLPPVRNFLWNRVAQKAKEKIVDVEARVVEEEKPKDKLFG